MSILTERLNEMKAKVRQAKVDILNLIAELRALEELTGESLESDDAAVVADVENRWRVEDPTLEGVLPAAVAPPEKEPGPRCPRCGSGWIDVHFQVPLYGVTNESRENTATCRKSTCVYSGPAAEFFPSSPQERWVPDAETRELLEAVAAMIHLARNRGWLIAQNPACREFLIRTELAAAALEKKLALPAPPAQPSPQRLCNVWFSDQHENQATCTRAKGHDGPHVGIKT